MKIRRFSENLRRRTFQLFEEFQQQIKISATFLNHLSDLDKNSTLTAKEKLNQIHVSHLRKQPDENRVSMSFHRT